jgi:hypothetical protein
MNETARKVLLNEKERWGVFRIEKEKQVHDLANQLEVAKEELIQYDRYITALQEALESD